MKPRIKICFLLLAGFSAVSLAVVLALNARAAEREPARIDPLFGDKDFMGFPTNAAVAYAQGQADARRDLTNGVVQLHQSGLPSPSFWPYARLLEQRCQVQFQLGGCCVTSSQLEYEKGYNEISTAYIQQKFGTNIFTELRQQAQKEMKEGAVYRVKKGDTLLKIARQYGVTAKAITNANPGVLPEKLQIGQELKVPPSQ